MGTFEAWLADAASRGGQAARAMSLATADESGQPDVRVVLLEQVDARGFVFCTNCESPKATALRSNSRTALGFFWAALERQVRIQGQAFPIPGSEADGYFAKKPRVAQIAAWASRQSQPMATRFDFDQACAIYALRHPLGAIVRPPSWSGFRVAPEVIEFWHRGTLGRPERVRYRRTGAKWHQQRLFP